MRHLRLVLAFAGFILLGIGAGASGVLIPSQIADYHVDRTIIGLMFFTFSAGYLVAGVANGALIRRLGARGQLTLGTSLYLVVSFVIGLRPPFGPLLAELVVLGFGTGILDAGLNAYLTALPGHTSLLNFLHAFFGVGALIGPLVATAVLHAHHPWQDMYLILAVAVVPLLIGFALLFPPRVPPAQAEHGLPLSVALRRPAVWLAGTFLCLYVGIEVTVGNWSFSLLTELRGAGQLAAGYVVSGYWLGLTLGRFVLNAATSRAGVSVTAMMYGCLAAVTAVTVLTWWGPAVPVSMLGFGLIGFFLGPVFPTTVAVMPRLTPARLVPTAVGLLIGASVVGGAFFPWLAGALAQKLGLGSLMPYSLVLAVLLVVGWWAIAVRLRDTPGEQPVPAVSPGASAPPAR